MSFWRFGFAAPSAIETLLTPSSPTGSGGAATPLHPATTLDKLLEEDDLLQEVKQSNQKLVEFLGKKDVVARLLGYISGAVFDNEDRGREEQRRMLDGAGVGVGIGAGGAVNVVQGGDEEPDAMLMSVLDPDEASSQDRRRARNPYLCVEILSTNLWTVTDTLFSSPSSASLLAPFWDHVLDRSPEDNLARTVQLGFWARANGVLFNTRQREMLAFVKARPRLLERMLVHFGASPVVDVLFRLVQCEDGEGGEGTIDWLANEHLVPRLVAMLGPSHPPELHSTVCDFLKNVTTFCTSAHTHPSACSDDRPPPQQQTKGEAPQPPATQPPEDARLRFLTNRLMREMTSEDTVAQMMAFALDECPLPESDPSYFLSPSPTPPEPIYPPSPRTANSPPLPNAGSATSSLIHCLALIADLIRRNNSDFAERQILDFHRRRARELEARALEAGDSEFGASGASSFVDVSGDRPPAIVNLGPLLSVVSSRLGELQSLVRCPRSLANGLEGVRTTVGEIAPLTLERYRIVELYAELLHCSNMALLNRPEGKGPQYDEEGFLVGGRDSVDILAAALERSGEEGEENGPDGRRILSAFPSPEATPPTRSGVGSPTAGVRGRSAVAGSPMMVAAERAMSPGGRSSDDETSNETTETPSELDSETGVLTKEEAAALHDLLAQSALDDHDRGGWVGSPPKGGEKGKWKRRHSPPPSRSVSSPSSRRPSVPVINYTVDGKGIRKRRPYPGDQLKAAFRKHQVLETSIDLFFTFPWNSFLHAVVYDIVQQVLGGRMDQGGNLMLARTLLVKAAVVEKIIQGDALNSEASARQGGMRMGYMGHMILMAEQVAKAISAFPKRLGEPAAKAGAIPQPAWDKFLRDAVGPMQEQSAKPLCGGVPIVIPDAAGSISSDEEESAVDGFARGKSKDAGASGWGDGMPGGGSGAEEFGAERSWAGAATAAEGEQGGGKNDEFARYFASQITAGGDRFSSSGSEDSDEDEGAEWVGASGFGSKDVRSTSVGGSAPKAFGFDDRFDSDGRVHSPTRRRFSFDEDEGFGDDFGPFSDAAVASDPFGDDNFTPFEGAGTASKPKKGPPPAVPPRKNLTTADWNAEFKQTVDQGSSHDVEAAFGKVRLGQEEEDGEDDFGDFLTAPASGNLQDSWTDFDTKADESPPKAGTSPSRSSPSSSGYASRKAPPLPGSPRRDAAPVVPASRVPPPIPNGGRRRRSSSASAASSEEEPLGPGVAKGAKVRPDGKVEAEVDGQRITVPGDEVALASVSA